VRERLVGNRESGDALSGEQGGWGKNKLGIPGDVITSCCPRGVWLRCDSGRRVRSRDKAAGPRHLAELAGSDHRCIALSL
jgi:hypothetical protein